MSATGRAPSMPEREPLDPRVLGHILLLQSALHAEPDEQRLAEFLDRGFAEVPGVAGAALCVNGQKYGADFLGFDDFGKCRAHIEAMALGDVCFASCALEESNPACVRIALHGSEGLYGGLLFRVADPEAFARYRPFLENAANLVALVIENRRQRSGLQELNQALEEKVRTRTADLEKELAERKRAEAELEHVYTHARCLFWYGDVEMRDGRYTWTVTVPSEEAAQRYLPLDVKPGQTYFGALVENRTQFEGQRPRLYATAARAFEEGSPSYHQAYRCRRSDGEIRWLYEDAYIQQVAPKRWHVVGVCTDITKLRRAQTELEHIHTHARCILWYADVETRNEEHVWTFTVPDEDATLRYLPLDVKAGQSFFMALGESRAQFAGQKEQLDATSERAFAQSDSTYHQEYRCRTRDGEIRWIYEDVHIQSVAHERWRVVGVCTDITERKRAEELLRENERLLLESQAVARIGNYVLEIPSAVWTSSPMLDEIFGIGKDYTRSVEGWVSLVHPAWRQEMAEYFRRDVVEKRGRFDKEYPIVRANDGAERWVWGLGRLELDADGNPSRMLGTIQDVTERHRAEEERRHLEAQVQHAQKLESLGVLAGGIAHDFNNLLMAILGNADLALDELAPMSPARGRILEIEKASKRAAELAKQMLAYSGKGRFVVEPIDLGILVEEMAHLLEVSISKKAVLKFNFARSLPAFDGDATQIRQVVMNLITNASEALDERSGVIALSTGAMNCDRAYLDGVNDVLRASLDEPLCEGVYVYIEVADTGCGMDAKTIEKIFDPFFTTKFTGRGLGMSAVLGIVRGHKGAIKIYSEPGKGTTFKALFPASGLPENGSRVSGKDDTRQVDWEGQGTVLIADDEETVCAVGKQMLERMGFDVLTASDGRQAVDIFRKHAHQIVCVVLDLTMPRMDGEQAFREMRAIRPDASVVLCSGYNEQDATEHFVGKGLAGFLQKPYNLTELRAKMRAVLAPPPSQ